MKDELIKLGFELKNNNQWYLKIKNLKNITIHVNSFNIVWIEQGLEHINLFPYNHDKVKQLIELLK